ncbi:NAD(P)H-dependent oxidoreductase [Comamonadaceae bacterium OTU4NAUVB1]|jgi:glutathione-regulated potassium-efflux system ancillary protein KefF|nr:NAD(P)H-dependent oxidoreductase [Comamonadaceae bacterium OTU4NAUVB1]
MTPSSDGTAGRPRIYLVAAHPRWRDSHVNRRLLAAARSLAADGDGAVDIDVNDLYGSYPDFAIDVESERERLAGADLLVLLHPIQWYSMPPLQKLWLDEVLRYGWAYGPGGTTLRGKDVWLVASTGGTQESYHPQGYNRYFFDAFLPPYEQTAALCGMRFLPPLLLHGASRATEVELRAHTEVFAQRLRRYPDWPEMAEIDACPTCTVPLRDRPAPASSPATVA